VYAGSTGDIFRRAAAIAVPAIGIVLPRRGKKAGDNKSCQTFVGEDVDEDVDKTIYWDEQYVSIAGAGLADSGRDLFYDYSSHSLPKASNLRLDHNIFSFALAVGNPALSYGILFWRYYLRN